MAISANPKAPSSNQQQPTVKVVKVFSSLPVGSQVQNVATKPLVQIVPNPRGNIGQPNRVVNDVTTPKVVSVHSLQPAPVRVGADPSQTRQNKVTVQNLVLQSGHKIHLQTPVSQFVRSVSNHSPPRYQVKPVTVQSSQPQQLIQSLTSGGVTSTLLSRDQLPAKQISPPLKSPSSYKPLESLQEVNRQATQSNVVSPVSAVLPDSAEAINTSPKDFRNQVTVSDRYRYIIPSPQTSAPGQQLVHTSPVSTATVAATVQPFTPSQSQTLQVHNPTL